MKLFFFCFILCVHYKLKPAQQNKKTRLMLTFRYLYFFNFDFHYYYLHKPDLVILWYVCLYMVRVCASEAIATHKYHQIEISNSLSYYNWVHCKLFGLINMHHAHVSVLFRLTNYLRNKHMSSVTKCWNHSKNHFR